MLEASKKKFFNLLHRAIKPEQEASGKAGLKNHGGYTEKRTRSSKSANTSVKQRGASQK